MKQSFILTILILAHGLVAQDQNLVIKKADVFKNGAAFITAEGALKFFNSEAVLTAVPQAVFGTLWMTSLEKQTRVSEIKSISRKNTATRKISSITELLKSNIGRKIIFNRSDDRKNAIQGTLQSVSGTDDRYIITIRNSQHTVAVTSYWYGGYFEFPEGLNDDYADTAETRVLSIRTNSKQANQNVRMHYFANQLAWAPSYIVDLTDDKNAQITLSATLINDAGLAETLRQPGPFTVFGPTDEAFRKVPEKTMADLAGNRERLRAVLTYHVVPGKVMAADVKTGNVKSVQGANLAVGRAGSYVTVEAGLVTRADLKAGNGVVHAIDTVLLPPSR